MSSLAGKAGLGGGGGVVGTAELLIAKSRCSDVENCLYVFIQCSHTLLYLTGLIWYITNTFCCSE